MIEFTLTTPELMLAAQAGIMRHVENLKLGKGQNQHGYDESNPWQIMIEGCCAEMVIAKFLGLYWKGKGKRGEPDVGLIHEVRNRPRHDTELTLHESDSPNKVCWHVTGMNGSYRINGWIYAHEGQKDEFWSNKYIPSRPAYFIPISALRPPETYENKK